jgi:hypothetical protein
MNYRKRYTDANGNFIIEERAPTGRTRRIAPNQPDYLRWLDAGNEPELVAYVPPVPPTPPTLEEAKASKLAEIAAARYEEETGGVTLNGISIDTSRESQALITGAALQATLDNTYTCRWKTAQGFITLNAQTILAVAVAARQHVQACFDREAELAERIETAATAGEVNAVTWSMEVS